MTLLPATGKAGRLLGPAADVSVWLGFAATPTFALMAWISAVGPPGMTMCSVASPVLPINDMALMYLLMGLFHLSPWLKLMSVRSPARPHHPTEGD